MKIRDRGFEVVRLVSTLLVVCCCLVWLFSGTARSAPVEQPPAAPSEPSPPGEISVTSPSELSDPVSPPEPTSAATAAPDYVANEEVKEALRKEGFAYTPTGMANPFISFISPVELAPAVSQVTQEEDDLPPVPQKPLTPLQKMGVAEIERGFRAVSWGELGRKAVIEDAAGRGYIVGVGTPAGDQNGMITAIFNDRLVIQQEFWDKKQKRMVPQNSIVKLYKEDTKK